MSRVAFADEDEVEEEEDEGMLMLTLDYMRLDTYWAIQRWCPNSQYVKFSN